MSSGSNDETGVPAGWELCVSKKSHNRRYYFNRRTGESSWTKPQAPPSPEVKSTTSKEEMPKDKDRKFLKRKCDGGSILCSNKKSKDEKRSPIVVDKSPTRSPVKKRASTGSIPESPKYVQKRSRSDKTPLRSPKPSPSSIKRARDTPNTSRSSQSPKPTPSKNTANARLSQLRVELLADVKNEEAKESKTPPAKSTPEKKENHESQVNTQSPIESAQAALSPSQFLAANKIIYSMKAQLPNNNAIKPKDAFADIEEGINNQTTEYPFMKHPATPPQFSEASKLMSAINSKLLYRRDPREAYKIVEPVKSVETQGVYNVFKNRPDSVKTPVAKVEASTTVYSSAMDRMESIRKRLSSDVEAPASVNPGNETRSVEAMDVDHREVTSPSSVPEPQPRSVPVVNSNTSNADNGSGDVVLVVDTNMFIHDLDFIKNVMNSHIEGYTEQPILLVPWRVVNELDTLKDSNNGNGAICKRARPAMDYLYKYLPDNNRIKVQPLRDANSHIYPCESADDEILNCCLQQAERGKSVILLSNDKNLCTKAVANGVQTRQLHALVLRPLRRAAPLSAARLRDHTHALLSNILENEMRAKYDNLWTRIVFKPPPWSLEDVVTCLLKHWIAVFSEVFPRIEYLIMDLRNCLNLMNSKGPNSLTQADLNKFKEVCIEIASRCQIIPEYMQLAKATVERLCESESAAAPPARAQDKTPEREREGEKPIIEAFEGVWTIFSSYCAKLANNLGIAHSVKDTLPGSDSLEALCSNLSIFGGQISALAVAMEGVLNAALDSPLFNDNALKMERAFKASLTHLGMEARYVTNANIRIFCCNCRIMLREAQGRFADLLRLLTLCKSSLGQ